jgi:hypothetical protein
VCGQHHAPAAFTPRKEPVPIVQEAGWAPAAFTPRKDPVPIVQEAGWAPEPVWIGAENLVPPGFDPRTHQPVASRYTDWAIPAPAF